jgi:hypothetical protein
MRQLATGVAALWLCAGFAASSAAAPITFDFTGSVTQTMFDPDDPFAGGIAFGTTFAGSYTFESTTADGIAAAHSGAYAPPGGAPYQFAVTIGGHTFSTPDFLSIGVGNDVGATDHYAVLACSGSAACQESTLELFLLDLDATAFTSDALLVPAPLLGAFEIATFTFRGLIGGNQVEILGQLESLTCSAGCDPVNVPVPEPGTLLLLTPALAVLRYWRGRRRPATC